MYTVPREEQEQYNPVIKQPGPGSQSQVVLVKLVHDAIMTHGGIS